MARTAVLGLPRKRPATRRRRERTASGARAIKQSPAPNRNPGSLTTHRRPANKPRLGQCNTIERTSTLGIFGKGKKQSSGGAEAPQREGPPAPRPSAPAG